MTPQLIRMSTFLVCVAFEPEVHKQSWSSQDLIQARIEYELWAVHAGLMAE